MMIGILTPIFLNIPPNLWIQEMRDQVSEQNRTPVEESINRSLEDFYNGSNDPTEQEELLQFSCDEDKESIGRGYDRCDNRPRVRPSENGEGKDCWSGHTREENEGLRGEGTWHRCDQLVEGEVGGNDKG